MKVDWGGKIIVNSMVNWGVHETHQTEHSTTRVHWGDHDPTLNPMINTASLKLIGELMIQVSSFALCALILKQSQKISLPKSCGDDYHKGHLPPLS